jgi:gliding motility-associated-like protein
MNKIKALLLSFALTALSLSASAQEEPYAELLTEDINVCANGTNTVYFEVKFHGESPFAIKYDTPKAKDLFKYGISVQDLSEDSVWTKSFFITYPVDEGALKRAGIIKLLKVYDDNTGWADPNTMGNDITGEQTTYTNWAMPNPGAGSAIDSCGIVATLNGIPDPLTNTYYWESPLTGTLSDTTNINAIYEVPEKGDYEIVFFQTNGACTASDTGTVVFKGSPSAGISSDSEVCGNSSQEATINLTLNGNGPWDYAISDGNSNNITGTSSTASTSKTTNVTGQTTFSYNWVRDANGCIALPEDISEEATVIDLLPAPNAGNDTAVCKDKLTLNAVMSPLAQSGQWTATQGRFPDQENLNPKGEFISDTFDSQTLTWTEINGLCTNSDDVTVRFDEAPTAFAGTNATLYHQYQLMLNAKTPIISNAEWLGEWYIVSGAGSISDATSQKATISGLQHGKTMLEWSVSNGVCPLETDTITITVHNLTYYTGISPNGDGSNDFFKIKGAHTIPGNEFIVFDQNGQVIYRQNNLVENNKWNGTKMDGSSLESGIYYFIFKGEGIESVKDYIVIKRK